MKVVYNKPSVLTVPFGFMLIAGENEVTEEQYTQLLSEPQLKAMFDSGLLEVKAEAEKAEAEKAEAEKAEAEKAEAEKAEARQEANKGKNK